MMVKLYVIKPYINTMVMVKDIFEASKVVRDYIESNNVSASQWAGGKLLDENNHHIGYITYNGRYIAE